MMSLPDWQIAPVWLAANGVLVAGAWRAATRLFPRDSWGQRFGHSVVIAWAVIITCGFALGSTGLLYPILFLACVPAVAVALAVALDRRASPIRPTTRSSPKIKRSWAPTGVAFLWAGVAALGLGHLVLVGLTQFPDDFDTTMYHLPLLVHWLQAANLYAPDALHWAMAANNELVFLWVVAPFSGDFLYALGNLPVLVLQAWAVFNLSRLLGVRPILGHLCALAATTTFVALMQSITAGNDIAVAAFFFAGLVYTLRFSRRGSTPDLALAATCLGLLAGVKYYALGYAVVLATAGIGLSAVSGRARACRFAVAAAIGTISLGGYWYIRNWVVTGTPVYPLGRTTLPDEFTGLYPPLWPTTFLGNGDPQVWPLAVAAVKSMTGPYHLAAVLGLPVSLVWLVAGSALQRTHKRWAVPRVALGLATIGALAVLLVTPVAVEDVPGTLGQLRQGYCPARYGTCFLGLALLCLTVVLDDMTRGLRWCATVLGATYPDVGAAAELAVRLSIPAVVAVGVGLQLKAHTDRLGIDRLDSVLIGVNVIGAALVLAALAGHGSLRWAMICTGMVVAAVLVIGIDHLSVRWHREFARAYDRRSGQGMFKYLDRLPDPPKICVIHLSVYPFFGSARQNRVCQPVVMRSTPGWWLEYLISREVWLVVVPREPNQNWQGCREATAWCAGATDTFSPVEEGQTWPLTVYRVIPSRPR